jgi:hypothetical protein
MGNSMGFHIQARTSHQADWVFANRKDVLADETSWNFRKMGMAFHQIH